MVSLENGLIQERVLQIKNESAFNLGNNIAWVDRCIVHVEFYHANNGLSAMAMSEGVTTPKEEAALAEGSNWTKTAGSFIAAKYKVDAKNWHALFSGKGREVIMQEAIKTALGLPLRILAPRKTGQFKPDVFHQYLPQSMDFFTSREINEMLQIEKKGDITPKDQEEVSMWRGIYNLIPQSSKPGADKKSPQNALSVILTEDIMPVYFDTVDGQDVLHCILSWAKDDGESNELGWVLPGKRDRAYSGENPDISVEDANYQLVEKELGISRSCVDYHFILGYFDDRVREQRMRTSGFVSLVVLNKKPPLTSDKLIGVPMNVLISLIKREIKIPRRGGSDDVFGLVRNHDSLLLNVIKTTNFYTIMENLKLTQAKWNSLLRNNKNAKRPSFPEFDPGYECEICADLLVSTKVMCSNGHTCCGECATTINDKCPFCRNDVFPTKINNLVLDYIILSHYPKQYTERLNELTGGRPLTWEDNEMFQGKYIQYK